MSTEDGEHKARELGVMFIETSAKSSYNVKQVHSFALFIAPRHIFSSSRYINN